MSTPSGDGTLSICGDQGFVGGLEQSVWWEWVGGAQAGPEGNREPGMVLSRGGMGSPIWRLDCPSQKPCRKYRAGRRDGLLVGGSSMSEDRSGTQHRRYPMNLLYE